MRTVTGWMLALSLLAAPAMAQGDWRPLFDGRTLEGWVPCNGSAPYTVEDGTITGRTVVKSPNSFLCTKASFGDFILEYDVKLEAPANSGVQVRSTWDPAIKGGRVHGLQVEIDPTERAWTGGLYDEARRGWVYTPARRADRPAPSPSGVEKPAMGAVDGFRMRAWNRFRVEAIGPSVRTWVNGVPVASIVDDLALSGIIALQVHAIGDDPAKAGQAVRFRDLRIMTAGLDRARTPDTGDVPQVNLVPNTLTAREAEEGWTLLWDGKTTAGWRGAKLAAFPPGGWEIRDGVLSVEASGGGESRAGGDIVTVRTFRNFELIVEFRLTEGANSGIKYFVDTALNTGEGSAIGCEFQLLDDERHPDAKLGVEGNRKLAGLYDLIPPISVRFNGIGEWNRARIVVRDRRVEHWLNGFRTVEYERATQMWRALVDHSKYSVWPAFGEAAEGHILLQDHGDRVSFRTIKIRELQ